MASKKLIVLSSLVTSLAVVSVLGIGAASAQGGNGSQALADKIATKFNLKSADVQKVIDEERTAHQAERKAEMKAKLDQAVKDGKITADQQTKLIAKLDEMQAAREKARTSDTNKSREDRKAEMDKQRTEFDAWLKANDIPADVVPMMGKGPGGRGHGDMGMRGTANSDTATKTTN